MYVNSRYENHGANWILVSGGADGVCRVAETTAQGFGIPVISFRVAERRPEMLSDPWWLVEEWRLHRGGGQVIPHDPTFADWKSAVGFKSLLIAERANTAAAFTHDDSRGTAFEIECFGYAGVPCEVFKT